MTEDDAGSSGQAGSSASAAPPGRMIPVVGDRVDSRDLFVATREITISHAGKTYRLRLTGQNKLILTK
jgi:hemin uptake protein HemP